MGVPIDIKPGSAKNRLEPKEHDLIRVEVMSMPTFDARKIDPLTVRFGPHAASEAFVASFERANKQGLVDLVFHFWANETGIKCVDKSAVLTGKTLDGDPFIGRDVVTTVDCHDHGEHDGRRDH
jgi:hypothetical protein